MNYTPSVTESSVGSKLCTVRHHSHLLQDLNVAFLASLQQAGFGSWSPTGSPCS